MRAWRLATCLIIGFAVSVSSASRAEAGPILLEINITYLTPAIGPPDADFATHSIDEAAQMMIFYYS